ncbi:MAG: hypothetical protein M0Q53_20475 [Prolixibacteraceae bacterium]|jgi:hypothetical protein|nr:hypothetical protein [Prolixibacteraceae bacterium]
MSISKPIDLKSNLTDNLPALFDIRYNCKRILGLDPGGIRINGSGHTVSYNITRGSNTITETEIPVVHN